MGHRLSKLRGASANEMEEEEEEEEEEVSVREEAKAEEWEAAASTSPSTNASNDVPRSRRASVADGGGERRGAWPLRLGTRPRTLQDSAGEVADPGGTTGCVCTVYRRTEDHHLGAGVVFEMPAEKPAARPHIDLANFHAEDYPVEDTDEQARIQRAKEMAEGVELPGFMQEASLSNLTAFLHRQLNLHMLSRLEVPPPVIPQLEEALGPTGHYPVHTQVDFIHCLVPDLLAITNCSFYWGKMDRYEAERLLEKRSEGSFLLRDSAQEEYLFSVSFRRYGRSLHARIEQWNHRFSFDSHDPGVFASPTVCGLIEHYKDPTCCMFFEPMLTVPLHRNFTFSLQHLCRASICSRVSYDGITQLLLPKALKTYLKEYHYRQRVRVRWFDPEI